MAGIHVHYHVIRKIPAHYSDQRFRLTIRRHVKRHSEWRQRFTSGVLTFVLSVFKKLRRTPKQNTKGLDVRRSGTLVGSD
jgi:hypothetical protein